MAHFSDRISVETSGRSFTDVTRQINELTICSNIEVGIANVFVRHTSASLIIQENADPDVRRDLERFLSDLAPDGDRRYRHTAEGPDDMPAHVRSVLTATTVTIPVRDGRLALGTWQAIYLWEHRHSPHLRTIDVTVVG